MALQQTRALLATYGEKLISGTISDEELIALMDSQNFGKMPKGGYTDPSIVNDANFSQRDGINDFVLTLQEKLSDAQLHALNERIIPLAPDSGHNTFMRNSTLEKAMLACEMQRNPTAADSHFQLARMQEAFSGTNDIANLKKVILKPIIEFFQSPTIVEDVYTAEEFTQAHTELLETVSDLQHVRLQAKLLQILEHSQALQLREPELTSELAQALKDTQDLLKSNINPQEYREKAVALKGHSSVGMKLLGGLMVVAGAMVKSVGVVFRSDSLKDKGSELTNQGFYKMKDGIRGTVTQDMDAIAEEQAAVTAGPG